MSIFLRVLGPASFEVDGHVVQVREPVVAAVAYLSLHGPVSVESFHEAMWPGDHPGTTKAMARRHGLISRVRRVLEAAGADDPVPAAWHGVGSNSRGYALNAVVRTDAGQLLLVGTEAPTQFLVRALGWVKGEPFGGAGRAWTWADDDRVKVCEHVGALAETVLQRAGEGEAEALAGSELAGRVAQLAQPENYEALALALVLAAKRRDVRRMQALIAREIEVMQAGDPEGWATQAADFLQLCAALVREAGRGEAISGDALRLGRGPATLAGSGVVAESESREVSSYRSGR